MRVLLLVLVLLFGCTSTNQAESPTMDSPTGPIQDEIPQEDSPTTQGEIPQENTQVVEDPVAPPEQPSGSSLDSQEIVYDSGSWLIHGTYYPSIEKEPKKVIVLVPQLGEDRWSYPDRFIERLHDEFHDAAVVAIDPRGHGESTNLGVWTDFDMFEFKNMKLDLIDIEKYFRDDYPLIEGYYVIGSSMGGTSALNAGAQVKFIKKVVMISPGLNYQGVELKSDDYVYPILAVASSEDRTSREAVYDMETSKKIEKIYQGYSEHGTDLFEATKDDAEPLDELIINFLD